MSAPAAGTPAPDEGIRVGIAKSAGELSALDLTRTVSLHTATGLLIEDRAIEVIHSSWPDGTRRTFVRFEHVRPAGFPVDVLGQPDAFFRVDAATDVLVIGADT